MLRTRPDFNICLKKVQSIVPEFTEEQFEVLYGQQLYRYAMTLCEIIDPVYRKRLAKRLIEENHNLQELEKRDTQHRYEYLKSNFADIFQKPSLRLDNILVPAIRDIHYATRLYNVYKLNKLTVPIKPRNDGVTRAEPTIEWATAIVKKNGYTITRDGDVISLSEWVEKRYNLPYRGVFWEFVNVAPNGELYIICPHLDENCREQIMPDNTTLKLNPIYNINSKSALTVPKFTKHEPFKGVFRVPVDRPVPAPAPPIPGFRFNIPEEPTMELRRNSPKKEESYKIIDANIHENIHRVTETELKRNPYPFKFTDRIVYPTTNQVNEYVERLLMEKLNSGLFPGLTQKHVDELKKNSTIIYYVTEYMNMVIKNKVTRAWFQTVVKTSLDEDSLIRIETEKSHKTLEKTGPFDYNSHPAMQDTYEPSAQTFMDTVDNMIRKVIHAKDILDVTDPLGMLRSRDMTDQDYYNYVQKHIDENIAQVTDEELLSNPRIENYISRITEPILLFIRMYIKLRIKDKLRQNIYPGMTEQHVKVLSDDRDFSDLFVPFIKNMLITEVLSGWAKRAVELSRPGPGQPPRLTVTNPDRIANYKLVSQYTQQHDKLYEPLNSIMKIFSTKVATYDSLQQIMNPQPIINTSMEGRFPDYVIKSSRNVNSEYGPDYRKLTTYGDVSRYSSLMPWHLLSLTHVLSEHGPLVSEIKHIVDGTSHIGVDAIFLSNFYKRALRVVAVEIDPTICHILKKNIEMVGKKFDILPVCENFLNYQLHSHPWGMNLEKTDLVYLDPPWGGPDYKKEDRVVLKLGDRLIEDVVADLIKTVKYVIVKTPLNFTPKHTLTEGQRHTIYKLPDDAKSVNDSRRKESYSLFIVKGQEKSSDDTYGLHPLYYNQYVKPFIPSRVAFLRRVEDLVHEDNISFNMFIFGLILYKQDPTIVNEMTKIIQSSSGDQRVRLEHWVKNIGVLPETHKPTFNYAAELHFPQSLVESLKEMNRELKFGDPVPPGVERPRVGRFMLPETREKLKLHREKLTNLRTRCKKQTMHGVELGKGGTDTLINWIFQDDFPTHDATGKKVWNGPLGKPVIPGEGFDNPDTYSGPHGPFYVVINDIDKKITGYIVPTEEDRTTIRNVIQFAVNNGFMTSERGEYKKGLIHSYDSFNC